MISAPETFTFLSKNQIDRIKKMKKDNSAKVSLEEIDCLVANEEEAFFIMQRLHSGEDKGRGTKAWNPKEQEIFQLRTNKKTNSSIAKIISDKYEEYFKEDVRDKMAYTNINRLFNNIEVRDAIGFDKKNPDTFTKERMEIIRVVIVKINEMSKIEKFSISREFNKRKRIEEVLLPIIDGINQEPSSDNIDENSKSNIEESTKDTNEDFTKSNNQNPNQSGQATSPDESNDEKNKEGTSITESSPSQTPTKPFKPKPKTNLNPIDQTIYDSMKPSKCKDLLKEIQFIKIKDYPYATGYLLRATIESLINEFLLSNLHGNESSFSKYIITNDKKIKIQYAENKIDDISNRKKILDLKQYLKKNKVFEERSLRHLDKLADFIDELNLSIHWVDKAVSINTIDTHWTNSSFFIEYLIQNI
ncbi:hypothetical protein I592_02922 [Enterococcus gilvus ATCC BAA-350]|uniref:Uncharacterized protein n=2 Tax=Enterococcus gilvus TaxID=160453 RepID=R2XQQ5_9ENTE|nr:hypothetical protein UKC_01048 [Enterococcus gilvus ATCC BAA-350]EOW83563.1 hypothetical protein I592_02922 [Enterococcus gilvus ATCC BAA-350]